MGYILDPQQTDSDNFASLDFSLKTDDRTLAALERFNADIYKSLSLLFLQDLGSLHLPNIMHLAIQQVAEDCRPKEWEIRLGLRMLNLRVNFCRITVTSDEHIQLRESNLKAVPQCQACFGIGSLREVTTSPAQKKDSRPILHAIDPNEINKIFPGPILAAHKQIAATIDEMRGRGDFDALLKAVHAEFLNLQRSFWHYSICVEATIKYPKKIIQTNLGLIRLPPLLRVGKDHVPVSSRWEAAQVTGENHLVEVTYFEACPVCLGFGTKMNN